MRILLVDDHNLVRNGIASLLAANQVEVVGEAQEGLEALEMARQLKPDLVLMDVKMPRCGGLEATRLIKAELPDIKVVMLTVSEDEDDLFEAIKSGAEGYLLKDIKADQFLDLIAGVVKGEAAISPAMAAKIIDQMASRPSGARESSARTELTDREMSVLRLLTEGLLNKEIALALQISENTVKYHLRNIMDKLHLRNRAAVAAYAASRGILPAGDT